MWFGGGKSRSGGGGGGGGWAAFDREQRRKRQGVVENGVVEEDPFPALPSKSKPSMSMTSSGNNGGRDGDGDGDRCSSSSSSYSNSYSNSYSYSWCGGPTSAQIQRHIHQQDQESVPSHHNDDNGQNKKQLHFGSTSTCSSSTNKGEYDDAEIVPLNLNLNGTSLPVEPEYEYEHECDDVYLRHRKQAFKTIRSASQHSKAATNAFLRGDHVSAHQHSLKAHHQWLAAETLNAKAAKDILSMRNAHHDVWKLDLHGLHVNEAVQVLHHHLHYIETKLPSNRSLSPNSLNMETRIPRSNSLESFGSGSGSVEDKQQPASLKQRPTSLQVITGVGNHSRGQASLPAAVRGFLSENGYRFEELKPGVISIRPKFRLLS